MARVLEEGITELLTSQLGTVSHMPPELLRVEDRRLSRLEFGVWGLETENWWFHHASSFQSFEIIWENTCDD